MVCKQESNPKIQYSEDNSEDKTVLMYIGLFGWGEINSLFHDKLLKPFTFLLGRDNIDVNLSDKIGNMLIHNVAHMSDP